MKTIALFGGTGRTGIPFLKNGVEKYKIKAFVRNPDKLNISHQNLEIITGDALNPKDVDSCISGCDVVVSLLGHNKNSPPDLQTSAIKHILASMKKNQVSRLISLTGAGVRDQQNDNPGFVDKMVVFVLENLAGKMAKNALHDGISHAEIIKNSDVDWTIVRGPMLTESEAKGKTEVGYVGKISGFKLTREDLAQFIINEIEENNHVHEMPFVTNG